MKSLQLGACEARLTLLLTIALVAFCFSPSSIGQESFKIGVVNTQIVLEGSKQATDATDILKAASERLKTKLDKLGEEIRTLQEKKAKTELFVERAQTADLDNEIRLKQQEYQREVEIGQQALLEKEQELMEPIYNSLQELIVKVGKSENFDIILEKRLITLYVKEDFDLTQRLVGLMNEETKETSE
ncbi:MAG: OmpH family outer membrane protein [Candidatus Poribacteria bacterium]|nr:OmpH family outer membrane protein [Candidatus Poribacteria bacterium]